LTAIASKLRGTIWTSPISAVTRCGITSLRPSSPLPGFRTEEIEPRDDRGEKRRRSKVLFPDHIATHCTEHIFDVNGEGLIFRTNYGAPTGRRRRAGRALSVRPQGFFRNQDRDATAGFSQEIGRHRNSRSGRRGDRQRRHPPPVSGNHPARRTSHYFVWTSSFSTRYRSNE
jgi:hypothetical protein